jgi:heme A synthase
VVFRRITKSYRLAIVVALLAGVSGSLAALGDTLYPASTLAEGVRAEFAAAAPALLRLRLAHPVIALLSGCFLAYLGLVNFRTAPHTQLRRAAFWVLTITLSQFAAGLINILLLAPVWMQLVHLFLATVLWVALCLMIFERANPQSPNVLA